MKLLNLLLLVLVVTLSSAPVFAAETRHNDIEVKLEQSKVTTVDGADRLVTIDKIAPGDVIQYVATYSNTTQRPVHGLKADLPIPQNTQYVMASANPANVLVSTDGENFSAPPLKRKVMNSIGIEEEVDVPVAEYRHLRWELGELAGGKQVVVSARVRVDVLPDAAGEGMAK